jgi:hypothetical protein
VCVSHTISIHYFPNPLRYIAIASLSAVAYLIYIRHWKWGIVLALLILFIFTAKYVTIIDLDRKRFVDAFSFFGVNLENEVQNFTTLNKIVISKGNYSQKANTRSRDRQVNWSDYTGTLIYDGNKPLDLLTRNDKKELVDALRIYATALKIDIVDESTTSSPRS